MRLNRRQFLKLTATAGGLYPFSRLYAEDWEEESPLVAQIRANLTTAFQGRIMALDFRGFNPANDEVFRIQLNASDAYPVASCFKAFLALYYFLNTPQTDWNYTDRETYIYRSAVFSDNLASGVLLNDLARRVPGQGNPIEKFNDFLRLTLGIAAGLHTWKWEGSPTVGMRDRRFAERSVTLRGATYSVDNVFTPADLARGYDVLTRGEYFARVEAMRAAIRATKAVLSIGAANYRSPIERAYAPGYIGKDGVLPTGDLKLGRVVNDAGIIQSGDNHYIIAFMSAGESESTSVGVLREVVNQVKLFEAG
jgi:hypothetical protein